MKRMVADEAGNVDDDDSVQDNRSSDEEVEESNAEKRSGRSDLLLRGSKTPGFKSHSGISDLHNWHEASSSSSSAGWWPSEAGSPILQNR